MAARLGLDPVRGLEASVAAGRLRLHGPNRLRGVRPTSAWQILVSQFASLVVGLLALAGAVAFAMGEWMDGTAILAVLVVNATIGFATELRAVRSMAALRELGTVRARVRRDGRELEVPAGELVPGDLVVLDAGDVVTADLRIVVASKLEVDESALTGESVPIAKSAEPVDEATPLADRTSMLFKGTALTRGSAEGLVVATGMATELGRIAHLVQEAEKESTPLEKRLAALGRRLIGVAFVLAAVTALVGILGGQPVFLMVETGIALAVAAVPEGLPIVATIALARGMARMARRHALVNRLSAVETLGATTVVFTDKTGTLTENRMAVRRVVLDGAAVDAGGRAPDVRPPALQVAAELAVLCNNATLAADGQGLGDPMEVALLEFGRSQGVDRAALLQLFPELREEAFDARRRMMATVHRSAAGELVAVKGAPEAVLEASTHVRTAAGARALSPEERQRWRRLDEGLAGEGLRVLALACREGTRDGRSTYEGLELVALLGLADPPRADVREAIAACRTAGIEVVMVTGDHAATAASIARAVGLVDEASDASDVVTGRELERLDDLPADVRRRRLMAPIFARVAPEQKLELIAAWQRRGHVVAMTGDGVNDAPALRKADIGIAMGKRGTQVAREAADMVLTNDAFGSIVAAVEQGRVIFDNIRKFVFYLLSCNVSEVLVVAIAVAIGAPLPLHPQQILFLNLVTDVFPALALAFGEGGPGVLRRPPRDPAEPLVTRRGWLAIGAYGSAICAAVLAAQHLAVHWLGYDRPEALTVSFLTLAAAQLWHVFDTRSSDANPWRNEVTRNPWVFAALGLCALLLLSAVYVPTLSAVLKTAPLGPAGWVLIGTASLFPLVLGELWRGMARRRG